MKFFIQLYPENKDKYEVGTVINLTNPNWGMVKITKIEGDKVFFKPIDQEENRIEALIEMVKKQQREIAYLKLDKANMYQFAMRAKFNINDWKEFEKIANQ